jgi:hypothetical protein
LGSKSLRFDPRAAGNVFWTVGLYRNGEPMIKTGLEGNAPGYFFFDGNAQ